MRQVFQDLQSGETMLVDAPIPSARAGHILVRTEASLISAGTERMLAEFGRGGYLAKARQQPDRVKQVLDKARTDGIGPTVEAVRHKLKEPLPMGYANAGRVVEVGAGVTGFAVGDLVASNGPHAEWASVPVTLAARVPEGGEPMDPSHACFATVGAIAMQSVRLAEPTLGERFVVFGMGMVGLLTAQLLRASGCRVLALDYDPGRLKLAEAYGAETCRLDEQDPLTTADRFTDGRGVDGVIIAAATASNDPMHQAATMSRQRGRIVLVGVAGLDLDRSDFYEKEIKFQVSASYGPGRYDPTYESGTTDYPFGFVRWTAARNQEAFLELVSDGHVDVSPLITHRYSIDEAPKAYELLVGDAPSLGIVLEYDTASATPARSIQLAAPAAGSGRTPSRQGRLRIGFVGAGAFTRKVLLPGLADLDVDLQVIASASGTSAAIAARQFPFGRATTDTAEVIEREDVDVVFITTRHDSHADLVDRSLRAGKHVFVEKPLAITREQLAMLRETILELGDSCPALMVGFNRRFAPQAQAIAAAVADGEPVGIQILVNAGHVPADSWLHDPAVGGGRIVGEACHFVDLARSLAGASITSATAHTLDGAGPRDSIVAGLSFANGSVASISYLSTGDARFPKERVEVFHRGRIAQLDNFRQLRSLGFGSALKPRRLARQDKGHRAELSAFLDGVRRDGRGPIPVQELLEVTDVMFTLRDGPAGTGE